MVSKKQQDDIAHKLLISTLDIITKSIKDADMLIKNQDRLLTKLYYNYQILEDRVNLLERHINGIAE